MHCDVEVSRDPEIFDPRAPDEPMVALLLDRPLRDDGDADPGLHRLFDGLGGSHLADDAQRLRVDPGGGEGAFERIARPGTALTDDQRLPAQLSQAHGFPPAPAGVRREDQHQLVRHQLDVLEGPMLDSRPHHAQFNLPFKKEV